MNKEFIKQEIKNLMEVIQEQQGLLLEHQGKIPQIEFDILMGNFRKAYELFGELNKSEQFFQPAAPSIKKSVETSNSDELIAEATIPVIEEKIVVEQNTVEEILHFNVLHHSLILYASCTRKNCENRKAS